MKLYLKYLKVQMKTGFSYKASAIFTLIGQTLSYIASLIGIYCLFDKFTNLGEYTLRNILLTYSIIILVFSIDEMIFRGFDEFDGLIKSGDLDSLLLRPRNIVLQIMGYKIEISKLGRIILGIGILIFACATSGISWTFWKLLIILEMILSGIITFFGVYLLTSSLTIFTIQKAEFINVFTDGGRELCYYPLDIFNKPITKFFTFVLPYASFNYLPLRYLLGMTTNPFNLIYPAFSIVFAIIGYIVFNKCLKHYKSAG